MFSGIAIPVSPIFAVNGAIYALQKSDSLGKFICALLFVSSIVVWVFMIEKGYSLNRAKKKSEEFMKAFREKRNPLGVRDRAETSASPAARVYLDACSLIDAFHLEQEGGGRRAMSDDELKALREKMTQSVEEQILGMEKNTMWLATAVSGSPFLGLFGTVWGITVAFAELAQAGRADVQTLAPGVSGALLTTVIALIVALPSMVGNNIIMSMIKDISVHLDSFVEDVCAKFKIEQVNAFRMSGAERE